MAKTRTTRTRTGDRRPLTPEQGVEQIKIAGEHMGRAQIASFDFIDGVSAARSVRLKREAIRRTARYGAASPEATAASARSTQHASFVKALRFEKARAEVPVPPVNTKQAMIYGRVVEANGRPVYCAVVRAVDEKGETLAETQTNESGAYVLAVTARQSGTVGLQAARAQGHTMHDMGTVAATPGSRTYRELVLPDGKEPKPCPEVPVPETPETLKVPDVKGMTGREAASALVNAGFRVAAFEEGLARQPVTRQKPAANASERRGTEVTLTFETDTARKKKTKG